MPVMSSEAPVSPPADGWGRCSSCGNGLRDLPSCYLLAVPLPASRGCLQEPSAHGLHRQFTTALFPFLQTKRDTHVWLHPSLVCYDGNFINLTWPHCHMVEASRGGNNRWSHLIHIPALPHRSFHGHGHQGENLGGICEFSLPPQLTGKCEVLTSILGNRKGRRYWRGRWNET